MAMQIDIPSSPSPLVGEGRGGGNADATRPCAEGQHTPLPGLPPQGGKEKKGRAVGTPVSTLRSRELRHNATDAERLLWSQLRRKNILGVRFRRQAAIGHYIADFACYEPRVIIELDGGQHTEQAGYDARRDAWFERQGFVVMRFWNHEAMRDIGSVMEHIWARVSGLMELPLPAPQGETAS